MHAAIGSGLGCQLFSFVVGIETQPIKEGEAITSNRDRDLGTKLDVASRLTTNNRSDVRLAEADDTTRTTSAVRVKKNDLLADQLAGNQELPIGILTGCCQKPGTTGGQRVDTGQITLEMIKLLVNRFADLVEPGRFFLATAKNSCLA